jgi:hypothetical protein
MRRSDRRRRAARRGVWLALFLLGGAAAEAATITVNPGDNLNQKMLDANNGDIVVVNAGTYSPLATTVFGAGVFRLVKSITVRANGAVTLQGSGTQDYTLIIQSFSYNPGGGTINAVPNNASVEGFTLQGARAGIFVRDLQNLNAPAGTLTGITLKNLTIDTTATAGAPTAFHGIELYGVSNSVIQGCTIVDAGQNGIYLAPVGSNPSNNNIIMHHTVKAAHAQNGIAIQSSDGNVIVGNTVGDLALPATTITIKIAAILLNRTGAGAAGSRFSRIEGNTIRNHGSDGITLSDGSSFNFVGTNNMVSPAYHPVSKPAPSPTTGSGIWLNNKSNGNYVYGNDASGSPETGFPVFMSSDNYLHANRSYAHFQGGALIWNETTFSDAGAPAPNNNVIHANHFFFNTNNAMLTLRGSTNNDVAYNFLSARNGAGGALAGNLTGGITLGADPPFVNPATSGNRIYENFISSVDTRIYAFSNTSTTRLFRNRFLEGSNNPNAAPGTRGLTYSLSPADLKWDASLGAGAGPGAGRMGGNHWSDHAVGNNPSPVAPYNGFIYNATSGIDGNGPYRDKFPFRDEHIGLSYAISAVDEPRAGQVIAQGTQKTIRWRANGCVLIDLVLQPSGTAIASNVPNTGYYIWNVQTGLTAGSGRTVQATCKTSAGAATGASASSGSFTVGTADLVLRSPGRYARIATPGTVRVAWKRGAAVSGNVNVILNAGSGETTAAANVVGDFADIAVPASISNQAYIRIQATGNANQQDSVDGYLQVRRTAVSGGFGFTTSLSGTTVVIGTIQPLRWVGPSESVTVDLDLMEGATVVQQIARNLPDFANYNWFVPEYWSAASTLRATFKNSSGATAGTAATGAFRVFYTSTPGTLVTRYRLNSDVTKEHLFTTDQNEYNVLASLAPTWTGEGPDHEIYNGPNNTSGVEAVPYYRLYDRNTKWHLWTRDRNEYFTLREFTAIYDAEGVDGYLFPSQVPSSIRLDRLLFAPINGLHHWTRDQNERTVLKSGGAWQDDALDGFVFCPSGPSPRPCP